MSQNPSYGIQNKIRLKKLMDLSNTSSLISYSKMKSKRAKKYLNVNIH